MSVRQQSAAPGGSASAPSPSASRHAPPKVCAACEQAGALRPGEAPPTGLMRAAGAAVSR